jgi:hypothetical protein
MPPELDNTSQVIDTAPPPVGAIPDTAPPAPAVETEPNWEEAADAEMSAIYKKNYPERSENGQFASREPKDETQTVLPDQAPVAKVEPPVSAINAPQSWSAEMKAVFPTLPPAAQEFIAKREGEAQAKITQQGQELSQYEPIKAVFEQHRDIFERNGMDYSDGLGRLLNAERMLEQNPAAAIAQIAQAYGVDLRQYSGQQPSGTGPDTALHQRIAQLESQLSNTSTRIEQREKAEADLKLQSIASLIEKFASDKPDWADLEDDIHTEIIGIRAAISANAMPGMEESQILARAYERAQRNNPVAWEKKQALEREAAEKKRIAEAAKQAEEAKRSKKVNVVSSPANGRTVSSMDDDLKATYRKINSA